MINMWHRLADKDGSGKGWLQLLHQGLFDIMAAFALHERLSRSSRRLHTAEVFFSRCFRGVKEMQIDCWGCEKDMICTETALPILQCHRDSDHLTNTYAEVITTYSGPSTDRYYRSHLPYLVQLLMALS